MEENKVNKNESILKTASEGVSDMYEEAADKLLDEIATNLEVDELARMPEIIFKEMFLPYFSGKKDIKEDELVIAKWIEFAGSPFLGVHIIDKDNNILFTTPPIFNSINFEADMGDVASMFDEYKSREEIFPAEANQYLYENLGKMKDMVLPKNNDEVINGWRNIVSNYESFENNDSSQNPNINTDDDIDEDDIIYY